MTILWYSKVGGRFMTFAVVGLRSTTVSFPENTECNSNQVLFPGRVWAGMHDSIRPAPVNQVGLGVAASDVNPKKHLES